ncbi:inorganic phosphate transporter [Halobacterium yunchengense]|uniref:inorganic phosphate transporter n=1 Tax=Halobacterium yunchengense TaxID=3108497 RepID=UPI0030089D2D
MALSVLFVVGLVAAVFVGVNVGGSSTGVAFGPATGSGALSMRAASMLMAVFVFAGGLAVGPAVVDTLGTEFVPAEYFTLGASIGVLLFIGVGILVGNLARVSVGTSQTAVGAVVGMGAALGVLDWSVVGEVVTWWVVSSIGAFWVAAVVGRYWYDRIAAVLDFQSPGRRRLGQALTVGVGCYMAFSAGASNVANAVAPLVGSGQLGMTPGVLVGAAAIGAGAFVLGPRTMETVGNDITDLPVEAALVVEVVAATVITGLSWAGIPASLAITATMCVIGLGWGRASRRIPLEETLSGRELDADERAAWEADTLDLYDKRVTKRIVSTWLATPVIAGVLAFVVFAVADHAGMV